jgi:hypothetical protein
MSARARSKKTLPQVEGAQTVSDVVGYEKLPFALCSTKAEQLLAERDESFAEKLFNEVANA